MRNTIHNRLTVRKFELSDYSRLFIELNLNQVHDIENLVEHYRQLYQYINQSGTYVIYEKVFGNLSAKKHLTKTREEIAMRLGLEMAPFSYVEGAPIETGHISTVFLYGIIPKNKAIRLAYFKNAEGKKTVGTRMITEETGFLYLFGLDDSLPGQHNSHRFDTLYERLDQKINRYGFCFNDTIRSWIYLRDINKDYVEFNRAGKRIFNKSGIDYSPTSQNLPASTCIEGKVANEANMNIDAICIDKRRNLPTLHRIFNKLQNEADGDTYQFKPTFARGVLLEDRDYREIQISGTASIGNRGLTEFKEDPHMQIKKTLINVEALMRPYGFGFSDICQSTCFFKDATYFQYFQQAARELSVDTSYINTFVVGNVCRDDLLFEMDGIAMRKKTIRGHEHE